MPEQEPPRRFDEFRRRADLIVQSPGRVQKLVSQAARKLHGAGGARFAEFREQLTLAIAMVGAWLSGDYRQISRKTVVVLVAALLYFVVPFDVIPDFLFGWGLLDDVAVLGYVFNQLQEEIEAFRAFQEEDK